MAGSLGADMAKLFGRELDRLATEIDAYESEQHLWQTLGAQKNPPGTLALHLVGNLLHYIGAELGGSGYVRDRDAEFGDRDVPRGDLLRRISDCRSTVTAVLEDLDDDRLGDRYPGELPEHLAGATTRGWLLHLLWHMGWHLGHIYYHRLAIES